MECNMIFQLKITLGFFYSAGQRSELENRLLLSFSEQHSLTALSLPCRFILQVLEERGQEEER